MTCIRCRRYPVVHAHLAGAVLLTFAGVQLGEPTAIAALVVAFVYVVVLTNVYNFMDGIDGLAASQAIVAGAALAIAGIFVRNPLVSIGGGLLSAGAGLGFAIYNLPPARMFMGDCWQYVPGFQLRGIEFAGEYRRRRRSLAHRVRPDPVRSISVRQPGHAGASGPAWRALVCRASLALLPAAGALRAVAWAGDELYAGLGVVAAGAALAGLYAAEPLRQLLALVAYVPMLAVVALVARLEQPNGRSNVFRSGESRAAKRETRVASPRNYRPP